MPVEPSFAAECKAGVWLEGFHRGHLRVVADSRGPALTKACTTPVSHFRIAELGSLSPFSFVMLTLNSKGASNFSERISKGPNLDPK